MWCVVIYCSFFRYKNFILSCSPLDVSDEIRDGSEPISENIPTYPFLFDT